MEARVKVLGHPVHPMLIVLPLGLLTGAVIFDVINLVTDEGPWGLLSYWLIWLGVLTGLLAAVFGLADWTKIPRATRARRVGAIHGVLNVIVVTLFAISWFLRRDSLAEPGPLAFVLSFLAGSIAIVSGWLGGELVERLGVGVADNADLNAPSSLSSTTREPASHS